MPFMSLENTVDLMNSNNYKDRFRAEYHQTKIRYEKLHNLIIKYEADSLYNANVLDFTPDCSLELLCRQARAMGEYLHTLEIRAEIEGIDLY